MKSHYTKQWLRESIETENRRLSTAIYLESAPLAISSQEDGSPPLSTSESLISLTNREEEVVGRMAGREEERFGSCKILGTYHIWAGPKHDHIWAGPNMPIYGQDQT